MKINATIVALWLGVAASWIGWEYHQTQQVLKLETAADLCQRVQNLEDLLVPLLVEFKVQSELRGRGIVPDHEVPDHAHPHEHEHPGPPDVHPPPLLPYEEPQMREDAEKWAAEAIKQYDN